jgi:hypothetical protein
MSGVIYIAKTTALFEYEGKRVIVKKGKTTIREGHPLLAEFHSLFEPLHIDYEVAERLPEPAPVPSPPAPRPVARVEEATNDPERPRRRGRPPLPRDKFGNIVRPEADQDEED